MLMRSHSEASPLQTGLSADTGVSHRFPWPPKAYLSSEALDEAVHKYLTVLNTKQNKNYSTEPKSKPAVRAKGQNLGVSAKAGQKHLLTACLTEQSRRSLSAHEVTPYGCHVSLVTLL